MMKRYQYGYLIVVLVTAAGLLLTEKQFYLWVLLFEVCVPCLLWILLKMEAAGTVVTFEIPEHRIRYQNIQIRVECKQRLLLATGLLHIAVSVENQLTGARWTDVWDLPVSHRHEEKVFERKLTMSGEDHFRFEKILLYDIFGIMHVTMKPTSDKVFIVYPRQLQLQMSEEEKQIGTSSKGHIVQNRKGNDISEVYDLKTYNPGDDLRSVHWKLSTKVDDYLVKVPGDTNDIEAIVFFDVGMKNGENEIAKETFHHAVELASSISQYLTTHQLQHVFIAGGKKGLFVSTITNEKEYYKTLHQWMSLRTVDHCGDGIRQYLSQHHDIRCSKFIYITVGEYADVLMQAADQMDVDIFTIHANEGEIQSQRRRNSRIVNLPESVLEKEIHLYI